MRKILHVNSATALTLTHMHTHEHEHTHNKNTWRQKKSLSRRELETELCDMWLRLAGHCLLDQSTPYFLSSGYSADS